MPSTTNMVFSSVPANQAKRMSERSCIPVYNAGGTARKVVDNLGRVTYK